MWPEAERQVSAISEPNAARGGSQAVRPAPPLGRHRINFAWARPGRTGDPACFPSQLPITPTPHARRCCADRYYTAARGTGCRSAQRRERQRQQVGHYRRDDAAPNAPGLRRAQVARHSEDASISAIPWSNSCSQAGVGVTALPVGPSSATPSNLSSSCRRFCQNLRR